MQAKIIECEILMELRLGVQVGLVEEGFPAALGADIFDGIAADVDENWSGDRFSEWTRELGKKYKRYSSKELIKAHGLVNKIMAEQARTLSKI
jgi:hypothetical protein